MARIASTIAASGASALLALALMCPAAAAPEPAVPLVSVHHRWDHHWFVWLPRHPDYEAVEVMSIDAAGSPYRAVWVFFTERRGGKRQVHYFDDRRIAENFEDAHYRPISYERTGADGRAQSIRVALENAEGLPVEIAVDLADRPLVREGAGLTDQSGHSAETLFLLFHRARNARTPDNEIRIGGRDYSFRPGDDPAGRHRFAAAYSAGIQIAVIPFGRWTFARRGARLQDAAAGISFAVAARGRRLTAEMPGYLNRIAVELDASGALAGYRHDAGTSRLALRFDSPLPLVPDAPRASRRFAVYMSPDAPVARGAVVSEKAGAGRRLTWRFQSPRWAADYPFRSELAPNRLGQVLTIRSLRP